MYKGEIKKFFKCMAATPTKAPKAWALLKFWVSIGSHKKQPVKNFLG
jgi:hypothetical protein